jgi:hypothetical protein
VKEKKVETESKSVKYKKNRKKLKGKLFSEKKRGGSSTRKNVILRWGGGVFLF